MSSPSASAADFSCAICLDTATEPVVTRCGHLFCWECLEHWLHSATGTPECPVCKGRVDERMAGDIIPLYGKGRQLSNKAGGSKGSACAPPTTAEAAAATAENVTTATADVGLEAFFSRPSAYCFCPARDARHAAQAPSQRHRQAGEHQHHPRPSADRAPPHPRPEHRHQFQNVHVIRGGMPLTMGSGIFFFGGGTGMLFSIFLVAIWTFFHYAPWHEWAQISARWFNRMRGRLEPANTTRSDQEAVPPGGATRTRSPPASQAPLTEDPTSDASPPAMIRHFIVALLFVFILIQFMVYI
ncbi:hypothetical protein JKF63_00186 [Porcisia hertigi]|uniref:RING-type E3 ubiquitin transferase n=1 Tax=Porcisia hertigi TaxID=2761500 RepID=A0A836HPJ2_9TRYP|nr:hypothetical protein JKF63_00186 [Porcisia hertigi]